MKAKIFTLLLATALFGANSVAKADTNLLNPLYYGAEAGDVTPVTNTGWWFPEVPASSGIMLYSFSTDHKTLTTDKYSVKFYTTDITSIGTYANCIVGGSTSPEASKLNIPVGSYIMKFKLYLGDNCPGAIQFWIQPGTATNNVAAFKLGGLGALEKNKWIEVTAVDNSTNTQPTTFAAELVGGKMSINIPKTQLTNVSASTPSLLYLDDISIYTYEAPSAVKNIHEVDCKIIVVGNQIQIDAPVGSDVNVFNTVGSLVKSVNNTNGLSTISVSSLTKGIYMVNVEYQGKRSVNKICL